MNPTDELSNYYAELLEGAYDCVDRVVLNAYFPMGQTGGGLRTWWRQLHSSDANLNDDQLRDMAGTLSRRLRAYCTKHQVPLIEAEGMGQLCKKQSHDMTPRAKGAGFLIHPRLPRQLGNQVSGNPVAKLSKNREFRAAWLRFGFLFFHPCRVAGVNHSAKSFFAQAMGCL